MANYTVLYCEDGEDNDVVMFHDVVPEITATGDLVIYDQKAVIKAAFAKDVWVRFFQDRDTDNDS